MHNIESKASDKQCYCKWAAAIRAIGVFTIVCIMANAATAENLSTIKFQERLATFLSTSSATGAVAAIRIKDEALFEYAVGCSDRSCTSSMPLDSRIPAGSIGKTFVAALALDLANSGILELDAHISKWLGNYEWFNRVPNAEDITLRMLLMHTSGVPDHANSQAFYDTAKSFYSGETADPDSALSPVELIAFILDTAPVFDAGTGYHYSDTGYILAGLFIERATGEKYYDLLKERILNPLCLSKTTPLISRVQSNIAQGYLPSDNPFGLSEETIVDGKLSYNPSTEWTGGGLISSAGDLALWGSALYRGMAFGQAYLNELLQSVPRGSNENNRYGLGVYIDDTDIGKIVGHQGFLPGYFSILAYHVPTQTTIAVQFNANVRNDAGYKTLRTELFQSLVMEQ